MKLSLMISRIFAKIQRKAYLSAESIQRFISEVYEDGENQFDILKEDAFDGIKTTYYDDFDNGYRKLLGFLRRKEVMEVRYGCT